jgi:hypothetical protein
VPDRFGVPAAILRLFASGGLSPSDLEGWAPLMERAGLHPSALALCCQGANLRWVGPLRQALRSLQAFELLPSINLDTIVAWSPLTYAPEIEHWTLSAASAAPDNLVSIRGLTVTDCPRLAALGRGWSIVGRLHLQGLLALRALRGPLEVFGDLCLEGLPELCGLGPEITVHGNLTLARCPALAELPADLRVEGAIWADAPGFPGKGVVAPWPGIQPRAVPIAAFPPGVLELAAQ